MTVEARDPFELQLQLFLEGVAAGRPTPNLPTWEDAVTNQRLVRSSRASQVSPPTATSAMANGKSAASEWKYEPRVA